MRGTRLLLLAVVAGCGGSSKGSTTPQTKVLTEKDILQRSKPAIVRIEAGEGDQMQSGTGFFVDGAGLVATNLHVISGKKSIRVKLHDGETYPVMAVAGIDPARDLAVMRIQPARRLPALRLGDSNAVAAGDKIVAIGNPLGVFDYSVTDGLISQVRPLCTKEQVELHHRSRARFEELIAKPERTDEESEELEALRCSQELTVLQISAPISQGSSGGPLFNQAGEVVGVTTAIITGGQNINLAIPANYLKPIVAAPAAIPMDEFAAKTAPLGEGGSSDRGPRVVRSVPDHPVTLFDGCKASEIEQLVKDIWEAIDVGAPLYNKGDIEACFKVYNFLATRYERDATCKGIRTAFGDGLVRVNAFGATSYNEKAWALRDTFDGLLDVSKRWAKAQGRTPPGPSKK